MKKLFACSTLFIFMSSSAFAIVLKQRHEGPSELTANEEVTEYFPESRWGQGPQKVTKELVYRQHPELKKFDEEQEEARNLATNRAVE